MKRYVLPVVLTLLLLGGVLFAQLQQSGGPGSTVAISQTTPGTTNAVSLAQIGATTVSSGNGTAGAGAQRVTIASDNTAFSVNAVQSGTWNTGLSAGVNNAGIVRAVPSSCTGSTNFSNTTAQVATGAGTTVTTTTTCVTLVYANNITNSPVTLRLADRQGTPVIWLGGNADFTIPPNSNIRIPLDGVSFTSGITAIAGTATAVNLFIAGLQ